MREVDRCKLCSKPTDHMLLLSSENECMCFRKMIGIEEIRMTDHVCQDCVIKTAKEGEKK